MDAGATWRNVVRWTSERSPRTWLLVGWVIFALCSYPGYMSVESGLQLFAVRTGVYTDALPPVMTGVWSLLELVFAGPFPMLALQSGLFLFGLAAILRTVMTPRAAALTACGVLLFPPVFAVMAVIWPDPLLAGCLLAATGALLDGRRGWQIAGGVLLVIACGCRPEIAPALIPLVLVAIPKSVWWKRAAIAVAAVLVVAGAARVTEWALTDTKTYEWQQRLLYPDLVSTLRKGRPNPTQLAELIDGLPKADTVDVDTRLIRGRDALDVWGLTHGDKRVFEPITSDEQASALASAWRRAIAAYPLGYLKHRRVMTWHMLGITGGWDPVFDDFGDVALLAPLHHRAIPSDWQRAWQTIVRGVAATPLFRPYLYVVLALALLYFSRKQHVLRLLVASGVVYEVTWFFVAPTAEYRWSHWLITVSVAVGVALLVARRWPRTEPRA
jgi:hypothetical protein